MTFENHFCKDNSNFADSVQYTQLCLNFFKQRKINPIQNNQKKALKGQMVVNTEGKIVSLNQKFITIWSLPRILIEERSEKRVFQFIAGQLANPENFLVTIKHLENHKIFETKKTILLKDGRSLAHEIKPQWSDTIVVGRIYSFFSLI